MSTSTEKPKPPMVIKTISTRLITGSAAYRSMELGSPNTSNPALQKPETAKKTAVYRPLAKPNSGIRRSDRIAAPAASIEKVRIMALRTKRTMPCRESELNDSFMIMRSRRDMRRPMAIKIREVMVIKPNPPICISASMTTWP